MKRRTSARTRRRRRDGLVAAALCSFAMLGASALPKAWEHWKYSRTIELPATSEARLVSVRVPPDAYLHATPFLADVRVIDDTGAEVPFAFGPQMAVRNPARPQVAAILENSFAPGHYTQVVLDLKNPNGFDSSVRINTPENEFMEWVEVAVSDDARVWRILQERAPIFRFPREGHSGTTTVSYSPNNARYLRLRVLDGSKRFPVESADIVLNPVLKSEQEPLGIHLSPARAAVAGQSAWSADLGSSNVPPLSEVRFQVGPGEFVREVALKSSRDNRSWSWLGSGEIYRFGQNGRECEQLAVPIEGTAERYVRVEVANGNDRALPNVVPTLYMAERRIVFEQEPGKSYRLLYGDSRAAAPVYDLERRLSAPQINAAVVAQAGPEEVNSDWADPRPWSETHNFVIWLGVAFAVLLIGYAAVQSLRRSSAADQSSSPRA